MLYRHYFTLTVIKNNCTRVIRRREHLSYKGGCGVHEHMRIETFKRRAGLGYRYMASAYY